MTRRSRFNQRENMPLIVFGMVIGAFVWTVVQKAAKYIRGAPTGWL
jgi:hypothetical protein